MLSIANLQSVFGTSPTPCLVLFPDACTFTIAYANQTYLDAVNRSAKELVGKAVFDVFPEKPENINRDSSLKRSLSYVLEFKTIHKSPLFRYNLASKLSKGYDVRIWSCDTYPLLDEKGKVEYIVRSPIDVTQFISGEVKNVREQNVLIPGAADNPLFDDYPDAVFTLDVFGNFLSVNKNLVELAECLEEELLQTTFKRFIMPEDFEKVFGHFQLAIKGEIQNIEANVITAKGNHRILNLTHIPIIINNEVVGVHVIGKDITNIKKAEQQIEKYNQRISNILESVTDGFIALDQDFVVTYWNQEAQRILLKSRDFVMGKNLWDVYPQAIPLKFYSEYNRAKNENISIQFEEYLQEIDSWLEVTVYPSEDGLSIFFKDVTKRIVSEEKLKQAKEQYQHLFDLSPLPNWVYDLETLAFLDVNKAAIKLYGYSREEFLQMSLKDIRPEEDITMLNRIIADKVVTGGSDKSFVRHKKKSGEIIYVDIEGSTISFHGKFARLVLAMDVTLRITNERKIKESIAQFEIVSKATSDAIYDWNLLTTTVKWNKGFKVLFGHSVSGLFSYERWSELLHPEDKERITSNFQRTILNKKRKIRSEYRFACADGTYKYVLDRGYIEYDDAGQAVRMIGAMQDVTERINYIRSIEAQNMRLSEISWLQSHMVRAPLAKVIGLSELLSLEEENREKLLLISSLKKSANELDLIIRDIINKTEQI